MSHITACLDGSSLSPYVCDGACWLSQNLQIPLKLLHVLEQTDDEVDVADEQDPLLSELIAVGNVETRGEANLGFSFLDAMKKRALEQGCCSPSTQQSYGEFLGVIDECKSESAFVVVGRHGTDSHNSHKHMGSYLEKVVRLLTSPVLMIPNEFKQPKKVMLAYDGSEHADKCIRFITDSPLFKQESLTVHVVTVGNEEDEEKQNKLVSLQNMLRAEGINTEIMMVQGDIEQTLVSYQKQQDIDLLIMGAYGRSRLRQFIVGSTTNKMIKCTDIPIIMIRE